MAGYAGMLRIKHREAIRRVLSCGLVGLRSIEIPSRYETT